MITAFSRWTLVRFWNLKVNLISFLRSVSVLPAPVLLWSLQKPMFAFWLRRWSLLHKFWSQGKQWNCKITFKAVLATKTDMQVSKHASMNVSTSSKIRPKCQKSVSWSQMLENVQTRMQAAQLAKFGIFSTAQLECASISCTMDAPRATKTDSIVCTSASKYAENGLIRK